MKFGHVLDSCITTAITVVAASTPVLLADSQAASSSEMQLLLLPLIGAMIACGGMIMLNPEPETRRIVVGRSLFALLIGALTPSVLGMFHPALAQLAVRPTVLVLGGAVSSILVYALSRPFTRELYARADKLAKAEVDRLQKMRQSVETETATIVKTTPVTPAPDVPKLTE